jgi:hypothetical protein
MFNRARNAAAKLKAAVHDEVVARLSPRRVATAALVASVFGSGLAFGQTTGTTSSGIDVSSVTAAFTSLDTAIGTVGGLIIAAAALAVTYKWVKGMIFG